MLGGSIDADLSAAHGAAVVGGAADRIIAAAALAHRYPNARIIFTGGSANLVSNDAKEADYAAPLFESLGISRDAPDDGAALAQHPGKRRILQGAGRARNRASDGCWSLRPFTCRARSACSARPDLTSRPIRWTGGSAAARIFSFSRSMERRAGARRPAVREWIGLIAYWATGKIDELLPGPAAEVEAAVATLKQSG